MSYLLAIWLCMPSFLMVVFSFSSLAAGLIATSFLAFLLTLLSNLKRSIRIGRSYLVILVTAVISVLLSRYLVQQPLSHKQVLAMVGLAVLAFAAPTLLHHYFSRNVRDVSRELRWTFFAFVVIGLVGVFWPIRLGPFAALNHPIFPFSEPSHFALAYGQVAALALFFFRRKGRLLVVTTSFLLAVGLPNTTMLMVALLLLFVTASFRFLMIFPLVAGAVIGLLLNSSPDSLAYFSDRLASGENLSHLVYMQGWESLISANLETNGIGIGFQNLGNEAPGVATEIIRTLTNEIDLNREDGGFLLAKIVGEFGLLGLVATLFLLALAIWSGIRMRHELKFRLNTKRAIVLIPLGSVFISTVEILVRGVGYFSPTFILTIYFIIPAVRVLTGTASNSIIRGPSPQTPRIQPTA